MILIVAVRGDTLLQVLQYVSHVFSQDSLDIPLVEHLDDILQFYLTRRATVGKVEGRNTKLIEQAPLDGVTFLREKANATDIAFLHLDGSRILAFLSHHGLHHTSEEQQTN